MMTKKERLAIKKTFGTSFPDKISERLKKKNVLNNKGSSFSAGSVRALLDGRAHSILENHVRQIWEEEIEYREKETKKIDQLIERVETLS